jgi:glutamine synthetase
MGMMRTKCFPISEFTDLVRNDRSVRISNGNLGTLQIDVMTAVCNPVGSICVEPDFTLASLRPMIMPHVGSIMAGFTDDQDKPLTLCPRSALREVTQRFDKAYGVHFLVGFEIEIAFCHREYPHGPSSSPVKFSPLDDVHAWGTLSDEQCTKSLDVILGCATALKKMGINVLQLHSEAGAGLYEVQIDSWSIFEFVCAI